MASYTTSALKALRALTGSSAVREIDTGFASLAADADAALQVPQNARSGSLLPAAPAGTWLPQRLNGGDMGSAPNPQTLLAADLLLLDKTTMVPAGRGWEWRVRSRIWVNDVALPAGVTVRAAIGPPVKTTPAGHTIEYAAGATIYGTIASAAALAASSVVQLDGAWFTAPDTAVDGVDWLLFGGVTTAVLATNGRVNMRSWLETRFT